MSPSKSHLSTARCCRGPSPSPESRRWCQGSHSRLSGTGRSPAAAGGGCPQRAGRHRLPSLQECEGADSPGRRRSRARERASVAFPLLHPGIDCARLPIASGGLPLRCASRSQQPSSPHPDASKPEDWDAPSDTCELPNPRNKESHFLILERTKGRKEERGKSFSVIPSAIRSNGKEKDLTGPGGCKCFGAPLHG